MRLLLLVTGGRAAFSMTASLSAIKTFDSRRIRHATEHFLSDRHGRALNAQLNNGNLRRERRDEDVAHRMPIIQF
jgi:hypothetical protein